MIRIFPTAILSVHQPSFLSSKERTRALHENGGSISVRSARHNKGKATAKARNALNHVLEVSREINLKLNAQKFEAACLSAGSVDATWKPPTLYRRTTNAVQLRPLVPGNAIKPELGLLRFCGGYYPAIEKEDIASICRSLRRLGRT